MKRQRSGAGRGLKGSGDREGPRMSRKRTWKPGARGTREGAVFSGGAASSGGAGP